MALAAFGCPYLFHLSVPQQRGRNAFDIREWNDMDGALHFLNKVATWGHKPKRLCGRIRATPGGQEAKCLKCLP